MVDPVTPQMEAFLWLLDRPALTVPAGILLGFALSYAKPTWLKVAAITVAALMPLAWEIAFGGKSAFGFAMVLLMITPFWVVLLAVGLLASWLFRRTRSPS
jgi:hypothetical protein